MLEELTRYAESSEGKINSFRDTRVAGLQGITDFVCSHAGEYPHFNSADVTEFFRLGEEFGEGYKVWQQYLGKYLENRLSENTHLKEGFNSLVEKCFHVSNQKEANDFILDFKPLGKAFELYNKILLNSKYPNMFNGKNVIVTGSNTGIGRAVALEFARRGANKVVLHYPNEKFSRGALSAEELIKEYGKEAKAFEGDFRNKEGILQFAENAIDYLGNVDVLVNNAGVTLNKSFEDMTFEDFDKIVSINNKGLYFVTQKVIPHMNEGTIINMSSSHALRGQAGHSVYAMTKAAIIGLTQQLAIELSPKKIRVNGVCPGGVTVANHLELFPEVDFTKDGAKNTLLGWDIPEKFAKTIMFLSSDESESVSGQVIPADKLFFRGMMISHPSCTRVSETNEMGRKYL